jgi:replicative DNA helicase
MNQLAKVQNKGEPASSSSQKSAIQELPKAESLENCVLGTMIMEGLSVFESAIEIFRDENPFYGTNNRRLYELIRTMYENDETVDLETVSVSAIKKALSYWTPYEITSITMSLVSTSHFSAHCFIILEKYIARRTIEDLSTAVRRAYSEDIFDVLQFAEDGIFKLTTGKVTNEFVSTASVMDGIMGNIVHLRDKNEKTTGVPSGFPSLDRITGGWQDSDLIILGAPSGLGKTAFALNLAYNAAKEGRPVGFFSLEMSLAQLIKRLLSIDSGVGLDFICRADLTDEQLDKVAKSGKRIAAMPIYIDDSDSLTVSDIRSKARKMKTKYGIKAVFVDYIQILDSKGQNREREVALISGGLKKVAKSLNLPVIALSQLNKEGEVRESKAIENDANILLRLDRASYKKKREELDPSNENTAELEIIKFRDGEAGITIPFNVYLWKQLFTDPAEDDPFAPQHPEIINHHKSFQNKLPYKDDEDAPF